MGKVERTAERIVQTCAIVAAFIYSVTGAIYIYLDSWTATHADFWWIYEFYFDHSWLETAALMIGGVPLCFPNLFWLASVQFFHGSQMPLVFVGLALLFITAALLLVSIWHDKTVGLTAKVMATLVVSVGNFWLGREAVTLSGPFNSENSLVMAAVAVSFLLVAKRSRSWRTMLIVICAGFVASFSFAAGFAIWPTLLLLAWCMRLRWPSVLAFGLAIVATIVIYGLLPNLRPDEAADQEDATLKAVAASRLNKSGKSAAAGSAAMILGGCLTRLVASPVAYATAAWHGRDEFIRSDQASALALWSGTVGLVLAGVAVLPRVVRRDLGKSSLEIAGLGLVIFNLGVVLLISIGRMEYFGVIPSEVMAPRYLFWSSLFWTGLFLTGIQRAEQLCWMRWPTVFSALAAAVFAWPERHRVGFEGKFAQRLINDAATALINGTVDDNEKILLGNLTQIARVTPLLRAHRLDMFADGLQDWIGLNETSLFAGKHKAEGLIGECRVAKLVQCDNGAPGAQVVGQASKQRSLTPRTLVIVDPTGVVRGVARSSPVNPLINRVFYQGKFSETDFVGYIRDYNPQLHYAVRSADDGILSDEKIVVETPVTGPSTP